MSEFILGNPKKLKTPNFQDSVWMEPFPPDYSRFKGDNSWDPFTETPKETSKYIYELGETLELINKDIDEGYLDGKVFLENLYSVTDRFFGTIEQEGPLEISDFYAYLSSRLSLIFEYFSEQAEAEYQERYCFRLVGGINSCLVFFNNKLIHSGMVNHPERIDSPQIQFLNELIADATIEAFKSSPVKDYLSAITILNRFKTEQGTSFMLQELTLLYKSARTQKEYSIALGYLSDSNLVADESLRTLHMQTWKNVVMQGLKGLSEDPIRKGARPSIAFHIFIGLTTAFLYGSDRKKKGAVKGMLRQLNTSIDDLRKLGLSSVAGYLDAK